MRAPENRGEGPPHILVVDDEPQIRQLLRTILEREGYQVSVAADGESALTHVETEDSYRPRHGPQDAAHERARAPRKRPGLQAGPRLAS